MAKNKQSKRQRDIKSKLMAAIAMLLVSTIMMVSSTYAWFTLSTAPEVTGITTAVGANGNLEMALLPYQSEDKTATYTTVADALNGITSGTGDSMDVQADTLANVTWGNLVNLSDESYGLAKISLYPAKLSAADGKLNENLLETPEYGSDGRVTKLNNSTLNYIYQNAAFGTEGYGVRAVGVSSGASPREQAYRSALATANSAANKANTAASTALSAGGTSLASIAMKKAMDSAATFTQAEVDVLKNAFSALVNEESGTLTYAEAALKNYIIAYYAANVLTDENYAAQLAEMEAKELSELTSEATTAGVSAAVTKLNELVVKVNNAVTGLGSITSTTGTAGTYNWADFSSYVTQLADIDAMVLNGKPVRDWLDKDEDGNYKYMNELMGSVSNLVLTLSESGIYVEISDLVGTFDAPVTFDNLSFGGWNVSGLKATMKVTPTTTPSYLANAKTTASVTTDTDGNSLFGSGGGSAISDYYGYIIDLAFRTNAADSYLQLQTDAIDRIYSDNTSNENTMGGGSTMTFSITGITGYTTNTLQELMSHITVVFFDPAEYTIYGYAKLDSTTADVVENTSVTMDLKMWDPAANNGDGTWADADTIVALTQNQAKAVSALVYLDGETITNAQAATDTITGTMNLQFSSSAELVPMEYGALRQASEAATTYKVTINGVDAGTTVNADASYTYTVPADYDGYTITVSMGGTDVTADVYDSDAGTITIDAVTGDIAITATETTGG